MSYAVLVTCEHGGNRVPAAWRATMRGAARALNSHRGWDPGALVLARELARVLDAPLLACTTTRLLVDAHRSLGHPRLFSEWTRGLPADDRDELVARWWQPHRTAVRQFIEAARRRRQVVLHLSVHSFTPVWKGRRRPVDVGVLYDPSRGPERAFAGAYLAELSRREPTLRLRRNQPYRGTADGLTTTLRHEHDEHSYLGIELEVSQRFPLGPAQRWRQLRRHLVPNPLHITTPPTSR